MKPIATIALLALVVLVLWFMLRRFEHAQLYFPSSELEATPDVIGLPYEDVYLSTSDGVRIHGWWVPSEDGAPALIFCHGNAGNISHRLELINILHRLGLNVFIFDYRGFGRSEGRPNEEGTYLDAEAAWRHLREDRGIEPEKIVIFGRSLGGAVAIELAKRREAGALIAESTFTSTVDMGRIVFPFLPVRLMVTNEYDSISKVGGLALPKLFIHSQDDELVPFEMGKQLYREAAEPKEFAVISGSHNDGYLVSEPDYSKAIADFLKTYLE